jgi:hypothetical protein
MVVDAVDHEGARTLLWLGAIYGSVIAFAEDFLIERSVQFVRLAVGFLSLRMVGQDSNFGRCSALGRSRLVDRLATGTAPTGSIETTGANGECSWRVFTKRIRPHVISETAGSGGQHEPAPRRPREPCHARMLLPVVIDDGRLSEHPQGRRRYRPARSTRGGRHLSRKSRIPKVLSQ